MIHQYKLKGFNIVIDVYSGSIHIVDNITYDIIENFENFSKDNLKIFIKDKYNLEDDAFEEAYNEVLNLRDENTLFSKDEFSSLAFDMEKRTTYLKALCLNVSHTCNLSCDYCFAKGGKYKGKEAIMSFDIAKKAIDFLIKNSGFHKNLDIDFFGGEPLLNFDVVKKTVDYCKSIEKENNKKFNFTLTTNGMLLDDDVIDYLNKNMKNIVLSLDGRKEIHDKFRTTLSNKGSYDIIVPKFKNFVEKRKDKEYYVRGTFTANNLDFTEDLKNYLNLGFKRTSMEPVIGKWDDEYSIKEEHLPKIFNEYEKLAQMQIDATDNNDEFIFYHYMMNLEEGPCVQKRISGCGSGSEYMAITPTGDIYPCHQFVGDENFKIGNLDNGIENKNLISKFKTCNTYSKEECRNCWAKMYCSGGCAANNFHSTGDIKGVYKLSCDIFKKRVECALVVKCYQFLKENS
ncbi:MAG: thioether cross-link-forming SCIFF peptide maturase [Peptoniphilaceae bacterium]|nr:thioether cross-link-forming SCIFF peptide maturase [Peptoniphilaceae bacterium]